MRAHESWCAEWPHPAAAASPVAATRADSVRDLACARLLHTSAMPHFCRICTRMLANEKFSGRGHRDHICRQCQRLPKDRLQAIDAESEIIGFFTDQSRISEKNISRLRFHCSSPDPDIVRLAGAVLSVALVLPFRRKRFQKLRRDHPLLFQELEDLGLADDPFESDPAGPD